MNALVSRVQLQPARQPMQPELSVTFRYQAPDEQVLEFVRRCAARCADSSAAMAVAIEPRPNAHEVRLEREDGEPIVERDPDVFLAVRNAFAHLHLEGHQRTRAQTPGGAVAGALAARARRLSADIELTAAALLRGRRTTLQALRELERHAMRVLAPWLAREHARLRRARAGDAAQASFEQGRELRASLGRVEQAVWGLAAGAARTPVEWALIARILVTRVDEYLTRMTR